MAFLCTLEHAREPLLGRCLRKAVEVPLRMEGEQMSGKKWNIVIHRAWEWALLSVLSSQAPAWLHFHLTVLLSLRGSWEGKLTTSPNAVNVQERFSHKSPQR